MGGPAIDLDALHRYLYRRTDPFDRLHLNLRELAVELDLSYSNLSVVIKKMAQQGRLRRIGGGKYSQKTYHVTDPAAWAA